jgi:beta-N-acetylhexosaminidase
MRIRPAFAVLIVSVTAFAARPPAKTKRPPLTADQRAAQSIMRSMSLRDRVAQLVIGVCYGEAPGKKTKLYETYRKWVRDLHIGGLIVNNRVRNGLVQNAEPHAMALFLNQMQKLSKTPLMVGADFERGASMRVSSGARFPYNMALGAAGDLAAARYEGMATAREARALGVHWIFAPVADVNNNPDNPVINIRSFGENPEQVSRFVTAYIEGARSDPKNRVLVTVKHFPGHGDTDVDSHLGLPRVGASKDRMEAVELKPFEAAIADGVDAVMTAHLAVPAIEPDEIPATASAKVLTGLLREELGFKGIIVTDALDMAGFENQFNSATGAVRAIEAGADVLLMPRDPAASIRAVVAAVESRRISRERIDDSVMRILAAKIHVGVIKKKLVDLDDISDALDTPDDEDRAQQMSDHAVTLLRNERNLLPLSLNQACMVVAVERRISQYGQRMSAEFRQRAPSAKITIVDSSMPLRALMDDVGDTAACSSLTVAVFLAGGSLSADLMTFIDGLTNGPQPTVLVAAGSPYIATKFPKATAFVATFSPTQPSEVSAVKALFGEIPISGHTPVTIPGLAQPGDGLQLARRQ